jgi:50S ribosomal protein L16 3-hydroxylase
LIASDKFDSTQFLRDYWQRRPLLIQAALPGFEDPLSAEELAGLALEPDIESRLIEQVDGNWTLQHGPFQQDSFSSQNPWTLLVQAVDHYIPAVAQLRQLVDFLPQWRVDDIMISYAVDGGGVGPHYDNYDVFLLQGQGQRRWRLGHYCDGTEALVEHDELRILENFTTDTEYLLEPGDILYVPPRLAHWGIAVGDCMTYSIGLRAPRLNDLLSRCTDNLLEQLDPELLYRDPPLVPASAAGEISRDSLEAALAQLQEVLAQSHANPDWFGELVTEPRYETDQERNPCALVPGSTITLNPESRLAWMQDTAALRVYANGESLPAPNSCKTLLQQLCGGHSLISTEQPTELGLLNQLYQLGCIDVD